MDNPAAIGAFGGATIWGVIDYHEKFDEKAWAQLEESVPGYEVLLGMIDGDDG